MSNGGSRPQTASASLQSPKRPGTAPASAKGSLISAAAATAARPQPPLPPPPPPPEGIVPVRPTTSPGIARNRIEPKKPERAGRHGFGSSRRRLVAYKPSNVSMKHWRSMRIHPAMVGRQHLRKDDPSTDMASTAAANTAAAPKSPSTTSITEGMTKG